MAAINNIASSDTDCVTLATAGTLNVQNLIYTIRGQQVMIDSDLAVLYNVETRILNQAVKRNIDRFPEMFHFQLTAEEFANLKSQIVISSQEPDTQHGGRRTLPYVFTEQGIAMLQRY